MALVVPLVLVNSAALYGQGGWAYDHLVPPAVRTGTVLGSLALCLLFAAAVESVGIYLAYEAHAALMEDQSSGLLRLGSYGVGLLVGTLNYAHFAPGYRPNPLALTFGLLSSISPWLWAIRSRSLHRADLLAKGLVDPRSVRFTLAQRLLYPVRSYRAYRLAVWNGINSPAQARADYDATRTPRRTGTRTPTAVPPAVPAVEATRTPWPVPVPQGVRTLRLVPPAEAAVPPAVEHHATPAPGRRTPVPRTPRTPERPASVRPIDSAKSDADEAVLAKLRATYPGRTPSLSEVSAVAGGAKPRAVRLRKLLLAETTVQPASDPEEHVS